MNVEALMRDMELKINELRAQLEAREAEIAALRASCDADIERAVRLALAYKDPSWRDQDIAAVLSKIKEQK